MSKIEKKNNQNLTKVVSETLFLFVFCCLFDDDDLQVLFKCRTDFCRYLILGKTCKNHKIKRTIHIKLILHNCY